VNSENYNNATVFYNSGEYVKALEGYYNCLTEDSDSFEPGDTGLVYHRLGNCLVKVDRYEEATHVYRRSLQDPSYSEQGSIHVNLGTALSALGRYEESIEEFQAALADQDYFAPYRAWMGMGNALTKLGRIVEAGTAYRTAALDPQNTNPVKALMNLGASFSALDRPLDAVEAYLAILDFRVTGNTLNRTYERLGSAWFAAGRHAEALEAFTDAQLSGNYELSERSAAQMEYARLSLTSGTMEAIDGSEAIDEALLENTSPAKLEDSSSLPALDVENSGLLSFGTDSKSESDVDFFTATDDQLIKVGKDQIRQERRLRHTWLKVALGVIVALVLALVIFIVAFARGFGVPSQKSVVNGFFNAWSQGGEITDYWVAVDNETSAAALSRVLESVAEVNSSKIVIISIDSTMTVSTVLISAQLPEKGIVHYQISMVREGTGWKINGIEMVFASQQAK
jgi:tetratricopeptide (TPR) repeat protein